jgi:microcystin degradation protein MlrC
VDERRIFFAGNADASRHGSRIVEHDLDMIRSAERPVATSGRLARILNWLMPANRTVGPPMRSVARELEEAFPARD